MNTAGLNLDPQTSAAEYYVLKHGNTYGPFHQKEILVGLETGQFTAGDFVQIGGQSRWDPIGSVSGEITEAEAEAAAAAPPWDTILKAGWLRLRNDIEARPFEAGAICLGAGAACMILASWSFLFWIPWFAIAAATAATLLRRKQMMHGALLLLAALCVPLAICILPLKHVPRPAKPLPVSLPAAPRQSQTPPTAAPAAEKAVPATIPGLSPGADAAPNAPAADPRQERASTPAPVAVTAHYGRQAPETPAARFSTATPAPSVPRVPSAPNAANAPSNAPSAPVAAEEPAPSNSGKSSWWSLLSSFFGNSNSSGNATPAPTPTPPPDANSLATVYATSLVLAKGDQGSGSGFICKNGTGALLYTNIHVVAKIDDVTFTRSDGVVVSPGRGELATGRDVARFDVTPVPQKPLEVMTNFDNNVRIGDPIAVLGNSGGGGVFTALTGVINGIGPDRIEVSAHFIPGNSGSPIIHLNTGKVIGIATYLTLPSNDPRKIGDTSIRRFGYRIDNAATWEGINWPVFQRDAASLKKITMTTEGLSAFVRSFPDEQSGDIRIESLRRDYTAWNDVMRTTNVRPERISATQRFLRELRFLATADISAAQRQLSYTYFRDELSKQKKFRDRITAAIDNANAENPSSLTSGHL